MSSVHRPAEGFSLQTKDPWDWTVDQVVFALTDQESFLLQSNPTLSLPDTNHFAGILYDNDVNGLALLTEVHANSLRDDLKIKSMGHRASINHLIRQLQNKSAKYHEQIIMKSGRVSSIGMGSRMETPFFGSPPIHDLRGFSQVPGPLAPSDQVQDLPCIHGVTAGAQEQLASRQQTVVTGAPEIRQPEWREHNPSVNGEDLGINNIKAEDVNEELSHIEGYDLEPPQNNDAPTKAGSASLDQQIRADEVAVVDETGRIRRRLMLAPAETSSSAVEKPTLPDSPSHPSTPVQEGSNAAKLVSTALLPGLESPVGSSEEGRPDSHAISPPTRGTSPSPDHPTPTPEPGVVLVDNHGKKRVRPILVTQPDLPPGDTPQKPLVTDTADPDGINSTSSETDIKASSRSIPWHLGRKADRAKNQIYLGLEPLPVDTLFYGDTALESQIDRSPVTERLNDTDDFVIEPCATLSKGLSLYVNARMKYYLQSQQIQLQADRKDCLGIIPYPNRIGKRHCPPSITIFSASSDGISASRSNRYKWVKDVSIHAQQGLLEENDASNLANPVLAFAEADDPDLKALEKWKYMSHQDHVLPVYGESGSEGEYELDTWKEIEQEQGEMTRPVGPSRSQNLTAQEVEGAIGAAIKQIEIDWGLQREPKLQRKAWRLWMKSRRDGTTKPRMDRLTQRLEMLDTRLANLQREIVEEEWSSLIQVTKQCKILQPSIYDREDNKWEVSILKSRKKPEKPPPITKKPKVAQAVTSEGALHDSEENLLVDTDRSESSQGSLEDFVVDDDDDSEDDLQSPVDTNGDLSPTVVEDATDSDLFTERVRNITHTLHPVNDADSQPIAQAKEDPLDKRASCKSPVVDLTLDSDTIEPEKSRPEPKRFEIKTPPLNASEDESDAFERSRRKKAVFKKLPFPPKAQVIDLESDSSEVTPAESTTVIKKLFPKLIDILAIRSMDPSELIERQDRKRLLTWVLAHSPVERRQAASERIGRISFESSRSETKKALNALLQHKRRIKEVDNETSDTIMSVAAWNVCWTIPVVIDQSGINIDHINTTLADEDGFEPFYDFLIDCLSHCHTALDPQDSVPPSKKRQEILCEPEGTQGFTPIRKRKYAVNESQETLNQREAARNRVRADEERRHEERRRHDELASRFKRMDSNIEGSAKVVINPGKLKTQKSIHLPPGFGNGLQIKEHQIRGLQFLWREITAEHKDLQGCLLAQTMGLGKTMQVIALLATLAKAAKSSSENIRKQVPPTLRESRTLVLCPPALLENWWDEFLIWAPRPFSDTIGELRKISVSLTPADRLSEIEAWGEKGGVLLIGYETFKALVHNTPRKTSTTKVTKAPLDEIQHESVKEALLHMASLVVADEAHYFKNRKSKLNSAMKQIQTRSRIALTGSPLNNNLQEYYTIIDWIAPNYLGTYTEFKATYEEPISEGLYRQSTRAQYARSRTKLKALEIEMEPKVHRANLSVLRTDLEGKVEFVVRLSLTKLQEALYHIFVNAMREAASNVEPRLTSLWSWLGTLQLLCNHPRCFRDRMLALKAELEASDKTSNLSKKPDPDEAEDGLGGSDEDATSHLTESVAPSAFLETIGQCEEVFKRLSEPDDALSLSNKMLILMDLLQFSTKARDKVLVFSHRIATLDYIQQYLARKKIPCARIDGKILPQKRQPITKEFNEGILNVCLISTRAGGTGLNFHGANRVVIMDEHFNPAWELQAIGRAYRIGQKKIVYVYRLTAAGTFEEALQNQALFKEQLATRVVDNKHLSRSVLQEATHYLFPPKPVEQEDLRPFIGKDPQVLDHLLPNQTQNRIMSVIPSETLRIEDDMPLSEEQRIEAEQMVESEQLRRRDPQAFNELMRKRFQPAVVQNRKSTSTVISTSYAPPSTQPIPWNTWSMGGRGLFPPSSTAPAFPHHMGGLPYPDVEHQKGPAIGPLHSANGSTTPPIEAKNHHDSPDSTDSATDAVASVEQEGPKNNDDTTQSQSEGTSHKEAPKRKNSLAGEEANLTKRAKPTPNQSPNFKAAGPMESTFRKLLEKEAARSTK